MRSWIGRFAAVTALTVVTTYLGVWLSEPAGPMPGTPLRMFDETGTDLRIAALTFSEGPDQRWRHLSEPAVRAIPPRWLHQLKTFKMGSGQDLAEAAGVAAAASLLGKKKFERPVGVYPGVVSGTSSGLAWAIATLLLNDPTLRVNGEIYATGAMYGNGGISSINGLDTKLRTPGLAEAAYVFVPASQYHEAIMILNERGDYDIARRVVGIAHVSDALTMLCQKVETSPSCEGYRS